MKKCIGRSKRSKQDWEAEVSSWTDTKLLDIHWKQVHRFPDDDPERRASQRAYNRVVRREARWRGLL